MRYVTDSNGIIAFDEPGMMGQEVFFHVASHGYEYPKDFFGNRGHGCGPRAEAARKSNSSALTLPSASIASRAKASIAIALWLAIQFRPNARCSMDWSPGRTPSSPLLSGKIYCFGATPTGFRIR